MVSAKSVLWADAPLTVTAVWKNGPVSAASTSGVVLNVPSPNEPSGFAGSKDRPPSRGNDASALWRADSTPVLKLRLPLGTPPKAALAPRLEWQPLQPT